MFCNNCGTKVPDGAKFCPGCGAAVNAGSAASMSTAIAPKSTLSAVVAQSKQFIKNNKVIVGIVAAVAVLLLVLVVKPFGFGNATTKSSSPSSDSAPITTPSYSTLEEYFKQNPDAWTRWKQQFNAYANDDGVTDVEVSCEQNTIVVEMALAFGTPMFNDKDEIGNKLKDDSTEYLKKLKKETDISGIRVEWRLLKWTGTVWYDNTFYLTN